MPAEEASYRETIDYLYALQKHGIKLALSNSFRLMDLMGDPHRKFRSVHVAGTNGKGSTAVFVANMLSAAGYRVGLYTSPHLISFTERMRVDGRRISEKRVVELARRVREAYDRLPEADGTSLRPTFFEVTTAMAFSYFVEENVDIAVVEAGMGGRLDATNVITPSVSIITNIDLEHTEFLGSTLEQIAGEKAGIVKPGVPLVTGAHQPEVLRVIGENAAARKAPMYRLGKDFAPENVITGRVRSFDYRGIRSSFRGLDLHMLGRHQVDNASLALAAIECLERSALTIDEAALRRGLASTRWEGRMELLSRKPDIFLDGAHNPASARSLAATVRDLMPSYRRLILVLGILGDKDYRGIARELARLADHIVVTKPAYSRALDVRLLAGEMATMHGSVESAQTVAEAVAVARAGASDEDLILVTGSLYVVGDARALFVADTDGTGALAGLKG